MSYLEIILKNIKIKQMEEVFCNNFKFNTEDVISSHFFDSAENRDLEYQNVKSLKEYFQVPGSCNVYLKRVTVGMELENALILVACDKDYGEITITIEENQFEQYCNRRGKLQMLMEKLVGNCQRDMVDTIILGYEPAEDQDMKMLEISQNHIKMYNENIFRSPFAREIFNIAENMKTADWQKHY